jgi:hypothetical protein
MSVASYQAALPRDSKNVYTMNHHSNFVNSYFGRSEWT